MAPQLYLEAYRHKLAIMFTLRRMIAHDVELANILSALTDKVLKSMQEDSIESFVEAATHVHNAHRNPNEIKALYTIMDRVLKKFEREDLLRIMKASIILEL